jgi:hypothetical protein
VSDQQPAWRAGPDGLTIGARSISFQRFVRPADGTVAGAPASLGALPVAASAGDFLVPVGDGEAFWIGLMGPGGIALEAVLPGERRALTPRSRAPELAVVAGLPRPDGRFDVLGAGLLAVQVSFGGRTAQVRLTPPDAYQAATGEPAPEPLDPSSGYGGWRLP